MTQAPWICQVHRQGSMTWLMSSFPFHSLILPFKDKILFFILFIFTIFLSPKYFMSVAYHLCSLTWIIRMTVIHSLILPFKDKINKNKILFLYYLYLPHFSPKYFMSVLYYLCFLTWIIRVTVNIKYEYNSYLCIAYFICLGNS